MNTHSTDYSFVQREGEPEWVDFSVTIAGTIDIETFLGSVKASQSESAYQINNVEKGLSISLLLKSLSPEIRQEVIQNFLRSETETTIAAKMT